jgi:tetratricopeptide (TPR) repeat protein
VARIYRMLVFSILLLLMVPCSMLLSQFDDDLEDLEGLEEPVDEGDCNPGSTITPYDSIVNTDYTRDDIKKWISLGHENYRNKEYKSAIPYLWKVFILDSGDLGRIAAGELATSYSNLGKADTTLLISYRGLELYPDHPTLHFHIGYLQEKAGRINCAIEHYEALVKVQPKKPEYLKQLIYAYLKLEDMKAIDVAARLVALDPNNKEYNDIQVLINDQLGRPEELIVILKERLKKDPNNINTHLQLAKVAYDLGEYKTAIHSLTKAIEAGKKTKDVYKLRAQCYESIESYSSAISDYKSILKIHPNDAVSMCTIAFDYGLLHQFKNGVFWINKALRTKPGFGLAYINMGEIYLSAISYCQNSSNRVRNYDDALVYKLAYDEFSKALNDQNYKSTAKSRRRSLGSFTPTAEEIFMNQKRDYLEDECYTSWINKKVNL